MQLTRQQLDFFTTFGYLHFHRYFPKAKSPRSARNSNTPSST